MKKIRIFLAILTGKIILFVRKKLGGEASVIPGKFGQIIYPDLIKYLTFQVKRGTVVVCGTNGKTTVNNLICSTLEEAGYSVACNKYGANMSNGIATALIKKSSVFGRLNADFACFEADELVAANLIPIIKPNLVVVNNLFRDQLDRYGEIDNIIKKMTESLKKSVDTKVLYNSDDPFSSSIARDCNCEIIGYSINENTKFCHNRITESTFCRYCGSQMQYNYRIYGQLGDFYCPNCDFVHSHSKYNAVDIKISQSTSFDIETRDAKKTDKVLIESGFSSLYMVYNILSAYAGISELIKLQKFGMSGQSDKSKAQGKADKKTSGKKIRYRGVITTDEINKLFKKVLHEHVSKNGRLQEFTVKNKSVILNLAKNPIGMNQNIELLANDDRKKSIIIVINDLAPDGTDISWLWDVDFELLENNYVSLYAGGIRQNDLQVRFKYAGLHSSLAPDLKKAVLEAVDTECDVVYVIVNYTPLFPTQHMLEETEKEYAGGTNNNNASDNSAGEKSDDADWRESDKEKSEKSNKEDNEANETTASADKEAK